MQPNNQQNKHYQSNDFFAMNDDACEGQRSFAEVVNNEEDDDQIGNIFNQGSMALRNEESEFVHEEVGSLNDADGDYQNRSNSEEEPVSDKNSNHFIQVTPHRQQQINQETRYGQIVMSSPDINARQPTYMPVYSQDDEEDVGMNPPNIVSSNRLSGRNSGVSEEDFYGDSQYSRAPRLFPHDMYVFPQLSQQSNGELHAMNYQQHQAHFLHRNQIQNDAFYFKAEDRSIGSSAFRSDKQTHSQTQKQSNGQNSGPTNYSVFPKLVMPDEADVSLEEENRIREYEEQNQDLTDPKLLKITEDMASKSVHAHSINVNEASASIDLKESPKFERNLRTGKGKQKQQQPKPKETAERARSPKKTQREDKEAKIAKVEESKVQPSAKEPQPLSKVVKGKRRGLRERKFFEKRRKMIEQVLPSVKEIGSVEWDTMIMNLSKLQDGLDPDKINPYNQFSTSIFWYYISSLYFPKCFESSLKERLCLIVNFLREEGVSNTKYWEKNFRDNATFIRKSYRLYTSAMSKLNRGFIKVKDGSISKKSKIDKLKIKQERNPTEIEDLLCQLEADREDASVQVDLLVSKILESIKSTKRKRTDSEENQLRQLVHKNTQCQQAISFYQEFNNFSSKKTLDYIAMEEDRYNKIKETKLAQIREQYEKANAEGNRDYIMPEPVGKSFLGMLRHSYESCFICSGDEYDQFNLKIQCSNCEYFVHLECLGENFANPQTEGDASEMEPIWTCQSCNVEQSLRKKFLGIDVSFKPQCAFCGLTGGLMRATTSVLPDIRKTPGCNNATQWSASSTNGITISNLTRKEKDYQIKLTEAKMKLWQEQNDNKPFPTQKENVEEHSIDEESLISLPEECPYAPSYVYWVHLSCSQWIMQKALVKKKPIVLKQVPFLVSVEGADKCEICGGSNGMLQTCTFNQVRNGEDKVLETLYKEYAQEKSADVQSDKVAGEFLDQMIEGGLCDGIQHPAVHAKNTKGCIIDICQNKMHIECARRAEYYMKYDAETEQIEFFCSQHTPLPMNTELRQSLEEQIKGVVDFAESYQQVLKESASLVEWTDNEKVELFSQVAETFFKLQRLNVQVAQTDNTFSICREQVETELDDEFVAPLPDNQDWRITLNYKKFQWQSISIGSHDSIDCWKKYWDVVGFSETRFRTLVLGTNKKHQVRYAKFVKLRQFKVYPDTKQTSAIAQTKPEKAEVALVTTTEPKPIIELKPEVFEIHQIDSISPVIEEPPKKKLTLRISPPHSQQEQPGEKRDRLRPRPERNIVTRSSNNSKPQSSSPAAITTMQSETQPQIKHSATEEPSKQPETPANDKIEEQKEVADKESAKVEKTEAVKVNNGKEKQNKRNKKKKEKKQLKYSSLLGQETQSCYCKSSLSSLLSLRSHKKQPEETEIDEAQKGKSAYQKHPKNKLVRCANKQTCILGGYFHAECCKKADQNFIQRSSKSKIKWFCASCKDAIDKSSKDNQEPENHLDSSKQAVQKADVSKAPELLSVSAHLEEVLDVTLLKKRSSRRFQNKNNGEEMDQKPNAEIKESEQVEIKPTIIVPQTPEATRLMEVEPIIVIQEKKQTPKLKEPVILSDVTATKKSKKDKQKEPKEDPALPSVPLIDHIIKEVQHVESASAISQQQKNALQQLKKAFQKYQTQINLVQPIPSKQMITQEDQAIERDKLLNPTQVPIYGEIEIKIDPVVKPQLTKKTQPKPALVVNVEEKEHLKQCDQIPLPITLADQEPTKLSLSQQFQINLQRKLQAVQQEIQPNASEMICEPIKLQLESSAPTHSKHKTKATKLETEVKITDAAPIQTQPVTIVYFNQNQTAPRNDVTRSMQPQHRGSGSGSPPVYQNPLEPKLAAGPASGYPQQYNQPGQMMLQVVYPQQEPITIDQARQQVDQNLQQMYEDAMIEENAEYRRKMEKRERKRLRKEARKRQEMEQNLINIDTMLPVMQDTQNQSLISISTHQVQSDQVNLVNLQTSAAPISEKPKKSKKSKKSKQQAMDIVIDTGMQPQMINIAPQLNYMMPAFDPNSSISISHNPMQQAFKPLSFQPPQAIQVPHFYGMPSTQNFVSVNQSSLAPQQEDPFVISIPIAQQNQSEVMILTMDDNRKKKVMKSLFN